MVTFAKVTNMPPPPTQTPTSRNFTKIQNKKLLPVVKQLATDSMVNNAMAVKEACNNEAGERGIFLDGTWQRRGHVSHNGVITAISMVTKNVWTWKFYQTNVKGVKSGKRRQMIPNIKSGKPTIFARSTTLEVPTVWKQLELCGFLRGPV